MLKAEARLKAQQGPAKDNKKALAGRQPSHWEDFFCYFALFLILFVYIKFIATKVKSQLYKFIGLQKDSEHKTGKRSSLARKRQ